MGEYRLVMTDKMLTFEERAVLDAIRECCIGISGVHARHFPHNQWACPDILAALREYGAGQRLSGQRELMERAVQIQQGLNFTLTKRER